MKQGINLDNLRFISISQIPKPRWSGYYEKLFATIPKGKAIVLSAELGTEAGARFALKRLQKEGKFLSHYLVRRHNVVYIGHKILDETQISKRIID